MGKQTELLDLQEVDSALDRLKKQRAAIPERAEADELSREIEKLSAVICAIETELHEAERTQDRLESEVSTLSDKIGREEKRLYGGAVVNPKELESLQAELQSLGRKRDDLETELLETMETVERERDKLHEVEKRRSETEARRDEKESVFKETACRLDAEIEAAAKSREAATAKVAPDLLAVYEKIRAQKGGLAAGELLADEGICGACRVELPAQELEKMLGSDAMARCPQCKRILVERP